jgi:hypothetical protein
MSRAEPSGSGLPFGTFGIDVDQTHLHGAKRVVKLTVALVALVAQPGGLRAPVDFVLRLPDVRAAAAETEGLEAHRFHRDVAGEDDQVGPGKLAAILLLDRPEQAARLVEVAVVRPAVEGRVTLRAGARAAATIGDAVGTRSMPGHAHEERPVVAVIGRPPVLRVGHQGMQVLDHGIEVESLELLGVIERLAHGVGL